MKLMSEKLAGRTLGLLIGYTALNSLIRAAFKLLMRRSNHRSSGAPADLDQCGGCPRARRRFAFPAVLLGGTHGGAPAV